MSACVSMCVYVCMHACMYLCMCLSAGGDGGTCIYIERERLCMSVSLFVRVNADSSRERVCVNVRLYVFVCMHVCMYVSVCGRRRWGNI